MSEVRITAEGIEGVIEGEQYERMGKKTVVCLLTLKNGFEIVGVAACVDPGNFDMEIGMKFSREDAINKIWQLEGYRLQCATN